jgi:hypothetical protein
MALAKAGAMPTLVRPVKHPVPLPVKLPAAKHPAMLQAVPARGPATDLVTVAMVEMVATAEMAVEMAAAAMVEAEMAATRKAA